VQPATTSSHSSPRPPGRPGHRSSSLRPPLNLVGQLEERLRERASTFNGHVRAFLNLAVANLVDRDAGSVANRFGVDVDRAVGELDCVRCARSRA
jgi:hypothetical protein